MLQRAKSNTGIAREVRTRQAGPAWDCPDAGPDPGPVLDAGLDRDLPPALARAARDYVYGAQTQSGQNLIFCTSQTNAWRLHWVSRLGLPSQPDAIA